jgi:ADP-heptose:LPS heptosyltransferase
LHDVQQNMNLAALFVGQPTVAEQKPQFPALFGEAQREWANEFLQSGRSKRLIAVHPGSSAEHSMILKRWAPERFALLADRICERLNAEALLLGGTEEESLKQAVAQRMAKACRSVPATSLRNTAALLDACELCLCNDSGIMHVASCIGVPTIAIFGPTDEKRNGPLGEKALVVRKEVPGFPLWPVSSVGNRAVPRGVNPRASLDRLSVDEAWEQIGHWLQHL